VFLSSTITTINKSLIRISEHSHKHRLERRIGWSSNTSPRTKANHEQYRIQLSVSFVDGVDIEAFIELGTLRKSELTRAPITRFGVMSRKICWQSRLFAYESQKRKKDFKLVVIKFFIFKSGLNINTDIVSTVGVYAPTRKTRNNSETGL